MYLADSRSTGTRGTDTRSTEAAVVPDTRPGRRPAAVPGTVLALGAVSLVTDISSEMVTAVLPLYVVAGLGLSPLGFGLLDGINNGVGALVRLAGGHLADRGGRRHKLVAGLGYGLSALCKPLLLLAHTLPLISAVLAADRTGKGLRTAPRDAMISLSTEPEHRGRAFGVHRAMDTTGALLGPLVAFAVLRATVDGYDAVFVVSACVATLGVLVLVLFVPAHITPAGTGRPSRPASGEPSRPTLRDSLGLLRKPELRRLALCAALLGLTTVSDSFLYLLLQRAGDLPAHLFPLLPLGTAAVFLTLAVPLGSLADRISRRRLFLAGHGVLLLGYGLVLSPWHGIPAVAAVLVLHGTFYAATDGVLAAATAGAVPERHQGAGQALVGTAQALARFACSLAFGAAWSLWGGRPALAVTAAALAVTAVVASFVLRAAEDTPGPAAMASGPPDVPPGPADDAPGPADVLPGPADDAPGPADVLPGPADVSPGPADVTSGPADSASGSAEVASGLVAAAFEPAGEASGSAAVLPGSTDVVSGLVGEALGSAAVPPGPDGEAPGSAAVSPGPAGETPGCADGASGPVREFSGLAVVASGLAGEASGPAAVPPGPADEVPGAAAVAPGPAGEALGSAKGASGPGRQNCGTVDETSRPADRIPETVDEVRA